MTKSVKNQVKLLPNQPGVYLFLDDKNRVLYVGKAKNLKNRAGSYFQKSTLLTPDKQIMVLKIRQIKHIIVDSELEALMLETNLIKQHQPLFNIILKDDKSYCYVKISREEHPRLSITREIKNDKAKYFGPYSDRTSIEKTLELARKIFPFRSCQSLPNRPCLYFHLKLCPGPCLLTSQRKNTKYNLTNIRLTHNHNLKQVAAFLAGKTSLINKELKLKLLRAKKAQNYELAIIYRDQLKAMAKITARQKIIYHKPVSQDVISLKNNSKQAFINLFVIRDGKLIDQKKLNLKIRGQNQVTILTEFIKQYYVRQTDKPKEVIVPASPLTADLNFGFKITIPKKGRKLKLIKMGEKNIKLLTHENKQYEQKKEIILEKLQTLLKLKQKPNRIECFDISNLQGKFSVGSMAVLTNGQVDKSQYRRFKIKTVAGISDAAMMAEVIRRRLDHLDPKQKAFWPKPDLIVVDGGRPQLTNASGVLKDKKIKIPLIALAKKQEEIFIIGQRKSLKPNPQSDVSLLLQKLRNEAHRFAIGYHKVLRRWGFLEEKSMT